MHVINACRCKYAYFSDTLYHYALAAKVETQNLASHKGVVQISGVITCMINGVILARETQDFASLLGWRRYFYHSDKGYRDYSRKNTLSRCFWFNIYFFMFDYDWHCNIRDLFLQ